ENQAVAMADGYARATGRTGYATVTGGPGFSNALSAIHTAHRAGSPVVVIAGAGSPAENDRETGVARRSLGVSWLKQFPQAATLGLLGIPAFKPFDAASAAATTRAALAKGRSATTVLILARPLLLDAAPAVEAAPQSASAAKDAAIDSDQIAAVADLLGETWAINRPLILAGRGAHLSGAASALKRLAELTGALLATSLPATDLFDGDPYNIGLCGTYATPVASDLIPQADCVLSFGATLNPYTTYSNSLFPRAHVIQVDSHAAALGLFREVDLGITGDARLVAEALVAELEKRGHVAEGFRTAEVRSAIAGFAVDADHVDRSTDKLIDPRTLMLELNRILPAGRVLSIDGGQHARFAIRNMRVNNPRNFMQAVDAGSIGLAMGTGVGAAVGRPGETIVVCVGDAGMMMALGDLETAVRLKLPLLVVVSNDAALGAEVNVLADLGMDTAQAEIPAPSFEAIARSMGAQAAIVRSRKDLEVVKSWLASPGGTPLVIDCRVNPEVRTR
ncbi:MAG: thiamine pyrophosphate-binding protein, partial [Burkholderiales bacterium]